MADLLLDNEATPNAPAAGQSVFYFDNVSKRPSYKNDAGVANSLGDIITGSSAAVAAAYAADTYIAGGNILIPPTGLKANSKYYAAFDMTKTAAGIAAATVIIRIGIAGTIADTARVTFTFAVGTALADTGIFEIFAHFRNVGAAAVLVGMCRCTHHLAATGLISTGASGTGIILANSAAFDSTIANSFIGISFNGGASFAGTNTVVEAILDGV